jgi:hypothetical protein
MISIENASLESILGELLGALLGIHPQVGHTLYFTPRAAMPRLEMLENVMDQALSREPEVLAKVAAVLKRSRAIMQKRHEVMHSLWAISDEPGEPVARIMFPSWKGGNIKLVELTDIIRDYRNLIGEAGPLIDDVQSAQLKLRASRRKSRKPVLYDGGATTQSRQQSRPPAKRQPRPRS